MSTQRRESSFPHLPGSAHGEQPLWHRMADAAGLAGEDGGVAQTIFSEMTQFAATHGALNLGQGAPGDDPAKVLVEAALAAMQAGANQYAPPQGVPALRETVAARRKADWGHQVDPAHVLVTTGATEALTAAIAALAPAGTEIAVLEPYYDSYAAAAALAGAQLRPVGLLFDGDRPRIDFEAFADAVGPNTSLVILNTPHNPTGLVLSAEELSRLWEIIEPSDARILTDEVYEHLVFDGKHVSPAALIDSPRVVTVSSAGKALNATGWKVGWIIAVPEVLQAVLAVKQFLTFTSGAPLQPAVASVLAAHPEIPPANAAVLQRRRDVLEAALRDVPGMYVYSAASGYFLLADFSRVFDGADAYAVNERLTREIGVTGIPAPALCAKGSVTAARLRSVVRYSFCKSDADVESAAAAFRGLADSLGA